jgi:outer membrane protein assembly factor BamB
MNGLWIPVGSADGNQSTVALPQHPYLRGSLLTGLHTVLAILLLVTCAWVPPLAAQFPRTPTDPAVNRVLMLAPREYQQQLRQAEEAIASEEYSSAIQSLAAILTSDAEDDVAQPPAGGLVGRDVEVSEDFFIGHPGASEFRSSLRGEARRLLGSLPPRGKELYRLQYNAEAARLLSTALESRDAGRLEEIVWRYFHTDAGYLASMLLGRHHMDLGRPLAASLYYTRLSQVPEAQQKFDPQLSLLLALCWHQAGQAEKAAQTLRGLRDRTPNAEFIIEGKTVPIFDTQADPVAWLTSHFGPPPLLSAQVASEWWMHRGLPSRNAVSRGGSPLVRTRWEVPYANNPDDEELIEQLYMSYREDGSAPIPSIVPLVVNDTVLLKSTEHLLAVDFETGKRIWEYPWAEPAASMLDESSQPARNRQQRRNQLEERLWLDAAFGQLASDGECVFLIDELEYVGAGTLPAAAQLVRRMAINDPTQPKDFNYLLALEIETQGKYRWRVGGSQGEDEPALAGAFFLGAPLVMEGELFVLAERRGDISLHVLDARTGKLRWSQQLAHVAPQTVVRDGTRRLAGVTPSYAEGVLVCPTSAGAVVAIDLPTRSLRWGYQYPREQVNLRGGFQINLNGAYGLPNGTTRDRWLDSAAICGEGSVLLTPPESDELLCLDLLTGEVRWTHPRDNQLLYVACIVEGRALLVGKKSLVALNLSDGQVAWESEYDRESSLARDELPSGRGFLTGTHYFLPTTGRLLKINVATGDVAGAQEIGFGLGNLVCYEDQVLSLGPRGLSTYYQSERLQTQVTERLQQNPQDAWALEHQGLLALERGDLPSAMIALREAVEAYPVEDDRRIAARTLMVDTLLAMLEADIAFGAEQMQEIEQLIDRPKQRERFLQLLGTRWLTERRPTEAFQAFLELANFLEGTTATGNSAAPLTLNDEPGRVHVVRRDRMVRAGLREAWELANETQRQEMTRTVEASRDRALSSERVGEMADFLRIFGDHPSASVVRLGLAKRYLEMNKLLETEQLLMPMLEPTSSANSGTAWALLARVYHQAERREMLAHCVELLRTQYAADVVVDGKTGNEWVTQFEQHLLAIENPWPYGQVRVEDVQVRPGNLPRQFQTYTNYRPIALREHVGPFPVGLRVAYDATGNNSIMISDSYGRERTRLPGTTGRSRRFPHETLTSKTAGHLVLVNYGHGLMAADGLSTKAGQDSNVLWPENYQEILSHATGQRTDMNATRDTNEWGDESFAIRGRRVDRIGPVSFEGVVFLQGASLHCVEPLTGAPLWVRHDVSAESIIWGDAEFVMVAAPGENITRVFRMLDGKELARRDLPNAERRWEYLGRHVLTWDEVTDNQTTSWQLRLFDPWEQRDIWSRRYASRSRGDLTPDGLLAIVEPSGRVDVLDVQTGTPLVASEVSAQDRALLSVHLISSQDQLMLVRNFDPRAKSAATIGSWPDPQTAPLIDGDIHAFDRRTGESQWQSPAVMEGYGLPLDQASDLPVLTFIRREVEASNRGGRRGTLRILCIDRRDGRLLMERDNINVTYGSFYVAGDPASHTVSIRLLNVHGYQLTFTDEPQPPAPPAQMGSVGGNKGGPLSVAIDAISNVVGDLFKLPAGDAIEEEEEIVEDEIEDDEVPE